MTAPAAPTGAIPDQRSAPRPTGPAWPDRALTARARRDPRTGRLLTSIQLFDTELQASLLPSGDGDDQSWRQVSVQELELARQALSQRRIDDGWDCLHSAQRAALRGQSLDVLRLTALDLLSECRGKLRGYRLDTAVAALEGSGLLPTGRRPAEPTGGRSVQDAHAAVAKARQMLDAQAQTTYLRTRMLGRRLVVTAVALGSVLLALGAVVASRPASGAAEAASAAPTLSSLQTYLLVVLLGALGALLSFALWSLKDGSRSRLYTLASGTYAALSARVLTGSGAALVVVAALEADVITLPDGWTPVLAVAAGSSERLVQRVVDAMAQAAERPGGSPRGAAPGGAADHG